MGNKALKGLTIKIGGDTSDLLKSIDKVEEHGQSLSRELGQINKLLKMDPKNTELLAQKQKVLADAITNTEKKLDTLREAEKQVQAQFERGEVSEAQYRALQREIIDTENKLNKYKNAAKETAEASKKLADGVEESAEELAEQKKRAEDAEEAVDDLGSSAAEAAKNGITALAAAAIAAVAGVAALAEESREYRTEMAKLNTAFQDNSFSAKAANKTYESLQGVLGETDQAVEAANNLAALCTTEEGLNEWTEILTGVYGKFGASLPVEGLAEAANETMRVGQVTGPLADALNWAAQEGETFGVKMKEATKANEEWNKNVEAAASAEDYFNLALEECSNEQERQQLITSTLTKLYGSAATQYKKTNAEVIRANQATERWNKTTAEIGESVEPAITDIKEFGAALLGDAQEPIEEAAKFVRKDLLPALKDAGAWAKANLPSITAGVAGLAAATVVHTVATKLSTKLTKGQTLATLAQAAAQKVLNAVTKAGPWGWALTAIAGVTAALVAYTAATKKAKQPAYELNEEEKALRKSAEEAAEAFREQKEATDEALSNVSREMGQVQDLADELKGLADASGRVDEKNRARADFILGRLNEALGTEYSQVDGLIQNYDELVKSIDDVIKHKTTNALLEAANEQYVQAIQNETQAYNDARLAEKELDAQREVSNETAKKAAEARAALNEKLAKAKTESEYRSLSSEGMYVAGLELNAAKEKEILEEKLTTYSTKQKAYENLQETILNYEKAYADATQGDYQTAIDLFGKKNELYTEHSATVSKETAEVLATLEKQAQDAAVKASLYKENFEKGVSGFTREMVEEAEQGYYDALEAYGNAYGDAYGLGKDFGRGLVEGIRSMNGPVGEASADQIATAIAAAKREAEINSPSKKTMPIGEGLSEGVEVKIKEKTKDVKQAASNQMAAVLDTYRGQEVTAQKTIRSLAERQSAQALTGQMAAATATSPILENILDAIQKGQVLLLDGDALVGGTADRMDRRLGQMRVLAARGAKR